MGDVKAVVLDGSQIRTELPRLKETLQLRNLGAAIPASEFAAIAESEAASILYGTRGMLPDGFRFSDLLPQPQSEAASELDQATQLQMLQDYLTALADRLQDDPLVVSILDGRAINLVLEDEDDFAMLAENLFTDLDRDDNGKLTKNELCAALIQMGVDMGVPPVTEKPDADTLLMDLLKKHGAEGVEELGQAQFAQLLQGILQDLADSLASDPLVVVRDLKVNNGCQLKKVLDDHNIFSEVIDIMFQELDVNKDGKISKAELRPFFERKGSEFGLPSFEYSESASLIYDQIFETADEDKSDHLEKKEFEILVKSIFEAFLGQLTENPVYFDVKSFD